MASSPLAGGFLTDKLGQNTESKDLVGTRFEASDDNSTGNAFRRWYDKPSMHQVNQKLRDLAAEQNVSMEGLALRWLLYHSALREEDGIIFGASNPRQVELTAASDKAGPLPEIVATKLDNLWSMCSQDGQSIVTY